MKANSLNQTQHLPTKPQQKKEISALRALISSESKNLHPTSNPGTIGFPGIPNSSTWSPFAQPSQASYPYSGGSMSYPSSHNMLSDPFMNMSLYMYQLQCQYQYADWFYRNYFASLQSQDNSQLGLQSPKQVAGKII